MIRLQGKRRLRERSKEHVHLLQPTLKISYAELPKKGVDKEGAAAITGWLGSESSYNCQTTVQKRWMTRAAIDHQVWSSTHKNNTEQTVNTQQMTAAMVVKEMDEYQQSKQAEQRERRRQPDDV